MVKVINLIKGRWQQGWRIRGYVPFTLWNHVWRHLDKKARSILEVGCGKGGAMRFLNKYGQFYTIGVDAFEPYLRECQKQKTHSDCILCDVRWLPFRRKSFDVVLSMQVLEHLEQQEGKELLNQMERLARKQVILSTDIGEHVQTKAINGNPYQVHQYVWSADELKGTGFKVYGMDPRGMGGETGWGRRFPGFVITAIRVVTGPLLYFFPKYSAAALCVKNIGRGE